LTLTFVCRQAVIQEVPGIARCFVAKAANENDAANVRLLISHSPSPCLSLTPLSYSAPP
jgi:hypothetical protein